jgi:GR25 family glycosyltransferase involved in LPS biosynthesis
MKAFVIGLESRPHSYAGALEVVDQLKSFGISAEFFNGIDGDQAVAKAAKDQKQPYPYSIKSELLTAEDLRDWIQPEKYNQFVEQHFFKILQRRQLDAKHLGKVSMPGVIGCFYSHLLLWKKCVELGEPIMIFEDDVKFYRKFNTVEWDDVLILSIGKSAPDVDPWKTYLENPTGGPRAVDWPNSSMPGTSGYAIKPHAASALIKAYRDYYVPSDNAIHQFVCKIQCHTHLMGRHITEDEGNISLTRTKEWK